MEKSAPYHSSCPSEPIEGILSRTALAKKRDRLDSSIAKDYRRVQPETLVVQSDRAFFVDVELPQDAPRTVIVSALRAFVIRVRGFRRSSFLSTLVLRFLRLISSLFGGLTPPSDRDAGDL